MLAEAPALVGLPPKWLYTRSEEDRALKIATSAARGIEVPLPVLCGGRQIAWVRGRRDGRVDVWRCALNGLDQMISAATQSGQRLSQVYNKISAATLTASGWFDYYPVGPGGGTFTGAALTARQFTDTSAGAIPHGGSVSPSIKVITGGWGLIHNMGACILLYDRVLAYEACTINGALQNMTNTLTAQRYISTGQSGLQMMLTLQAAIGAARDLTALAYTDQAGNTGQAMPTGTTITMTSTATTPDTGTPARCIAQYAGGATSDVLFLPLAAGDSGVQKIESFTTNAATTGTILFALVHPIAYITTPNAALAGQYDFLRQLAVIERIYDGACLNLAVCATSTSNAAIVGALDFVWS